MATVLTVALSVVSRSISDVSITTQQEESLRAFSAAEAGVEEALVSQVPLGTELNETVSEPGTSAEAEFSASIVGFPNESRDYIYPIEIASGDSATVWLMGHDGNNNLVCGSGGQACFTGSTLEFCWGKDGTTVSGATAPAVEISVLYENAGAYHISRATVDPNSSRRGSNGFGAPDAANSSGACTVGAQEFVARERVNLNSIGIPAGVTGSAGAMKLVKVRMLYNTDQTQTLAVRSQGNNLPAQGKKIDSEGQAGESTRRVEVYALYPDVPSIFDSAIFSATGITK
jgi:hypothetical protein